MIEPGHRRVETRPSMYCALMPKGWKTRTTGAGARPSTDEDLRTTKVRISPDTSMVVAPRADVSPLHAAAATRGHASRAIRNRTRRAVDTSDSDVTVSSHRAGPAALRGPTKVGRYVG